jgi:RHS repeat-associated protein
VVGNTLSVTNPRGTVTSYVYDADYQQTQRIDAYGASLQRTTTTVYDSVANTLSMTSPIGAVTSCAYDALNRQTQVIEAFNSSVQRTMTTVFDAVGNVLSTTNPRGYVTSFAYDALNRRVQELDAYGTSLQRTLTTVYDAVSNVLSLTNGLGVVTSFSYDALNRRVAELDAYGTSLQRTLTTVYDSDDNVIASIDALAYATTFGYDPLNRQVSVLDSGGGIATTVYDANNNVVNAIDPLGHTSTYVYDALNRQTQSIDARGGIVTLTYDANDNMLSLTDPVNNLTQWVYDALDRKTQETDPLNKVATFVYDAADRLTSTIDRNGQHIAYNYDLLNRETGENWYNASGTQVNVLTFTYDANDNLLTAANDAATNTLSYDALDRTASVQSPFATVLTYSYDAANNRTLVQDSFGGITTRVYDALNRVTTIMFGGTSQTPLREDFTYTPRDQVAGQIRFSDLAGANEIGSSTFTYDSMGRLANLQHLDGSGVNIANYTNTYDLASRITSETLNGGLPTSYSYDATNELTNDSVVTYSYDLNGNRTMPGYTTGLANELTSDGTWTYTYDKNGNVIGQTNPSTGEVFSYGYDNRNRLVSAQDTTTSGVQMQATYVYDAMGQRIEKDVTQSGGTTTTCFVYDGRQIWADLNSANALQTRYVRGDQVLELLARIVSGTAAWFLADRMGSVRNVADNTGTVIDTITYDGYGNVVTETSPSSGGSYKFAGYRYESETGLYRPDPTTGRYYNPLTGLWLGRDPISFNDPDVNLYRYVRSDPTNAVDPRGLEPIQADFLNLRIALAHNRYGSWLLAQESTHADLAKKVKWQTQTLIAFCPNKATAKKDKDTVIAFVQIIQRTDVKGKLLKVTGYKAERMTKEGWRIDRRDVQMYGWYGWLDTGKPSKHVSSTWNDKQVPWMHDAPSERLLEKRNIRNEKWNFQAYGIAKNGPDVGKVYGGFEWGFDVDKDGHLNPHPVKFRNTMSPEFVKAVDKWNEVAEKTKKQQPLGPFGPNWPRLLFLWLIGRLFGPTL